MHEASLVESLLRQVVSLMQEHGAQRVHTIRVCVGEFSGVEPELFRSAYELLVDDSPARGAALELRTVPLRARCSACHQEFSVQQFCFQCPACECRQVDTIQGEDLLLESVALEDLNTPDS